MPGRLICFVCGSPGASLALRIRQHDREPYFPFLVHHEPPKGARMPSSDAVIDSCNVCYMFLTQQWDSYEKSKTPAVKRLYWLKRADNGNFTGAEMRIQGEYIAQVMGLQYPPGFEDGGSPENSNLPPEQDFSNKGTSSSNKYQKDEQQVSKSHAELTPKTSVKDSALDLSTPKKETERQHSAQDHPSNHTAVKKLVCYICGQLHSHPNLVNVAQQSKNDPYFPILEKITPPPGSEFISRDGQVKVCDQCKNVLYQQWQAYEMSGTPVAVRNFKIPSEFLSQRSFEPGHGHSVIKTEGSKTDQPSDFYCYICGQSYISDHVRLLNTLPPKRSSPTAMFYPFVRDLKRPPCAEPLRSDGSVIVCIKCFGHLSYQWEIQEVKNVALYHRQYSLHFLSSNNDQLSDQVPQQSPASSSKEQTQPLNVQISAASPMQSNSTAIDYPSTQGLLVIAGQGDTDSRPVSRCSNSSSSPVKSYSSFTDSTLKLGSEAFTSSSTRTVPHPLQQVNEIPKKVCFLCAEKCIIHKMKFLCSYPARHEAKHTSSQVDPFFPFLANCNPASGAEPLTEEGTVIVCKLCYYSLLKQWSEYEHSTNPADSNRWLRKYGMPQYVCYVCSVVETERKFMRSIAVKKFHFLRDHKPPHGSLVIDNGEKVAVCKPCAYSLMKQFAEFERMGLPPQLRKFNWNQKTTPGLPDSGAEDESQDGYRDDRPPSHHGDTDIDPGRDEHEHGAHQGSKPPPLNMLSPAGSKLQRNTATVSPLHHVTSPTNGVNSMGSNAALSASRTSSFAAALRKLANQAKEPSDESTKPSSKCSSPRDSVTKPGPPPLVYTSTTLTSPPVVTIAPTQSHPSMLSSTDTRPSLERLHSGSSMFETVGGGKLDRPHSSASRDDDRSSSRDNHSQSARSRMTPHSTPGTVSPMSAREETSARGFQPYRPGEDMRDPRHSLPSSLALEQAAAAAAAYSYPAAFLPPHAFPHPAFRFDDPMLIERYRMMQSPYMPYPQSMMAHPGLHPLLTAGSRYPGDMYPPQYTQGFPQAGRIPPEHRSPSLLSERQRLEEEKQRELEREREKEMEREKERELLLHRERQRVLEREVEKQRERDRERERERERHIHRDIERRDSAEKSRLELTGSKYGSVIQGTSKGLGIADRYPRVTATSSSLHLSRKDERRDERGDERRDEQRNIKDEYTFPGTDSRPSSQKSISDEAEKRYSLVNPLRETDRSRYTGHDDDRPRPLSHDHRTRPLSSEDRQRPLSHEGDRSYHLAHGGERLHRPLSHDGEKQHRMSHDGERQHRMSHDSERPRLLSHDLDRPRPPPLISPQSREDNQHKGSHKLHSEGGLFRPFDSKQQLPNGYESQSSETRDSDKDKRDSGRDKLFHYKPETDKGFSHQERQYSSHEKKPLSRETTESDSSHSHKFGSSVSAFHSLDGHVPKSTSAITVSESRTRNQSLSIEQTSDRHYRDSTHSQSSFSTTLNVPSYNTTGSQITAIPSAIVTNYSSSQHKHHTTSLPSVSTVKTPESQVHYTPESCVSRLDVEERRLQDTRRHGNQGCSDSDCDVSSEDEVKMRMKKTFIVSHPPLKIDNSRPKLKLLSQLGLTTQKRRKDVEFERLRKRRRRMRERSVSPVVMEDRPVELLPLSSHQPPEELCREPDYKQKSHFLSQFYNLEPVAPEERKVNEKILQACEAEKQRRLLQTKVDDTDIQTRGTSGIKRKHEDSSSLYLVSDSKKELDTSTQCVQNITNINATTTKTVASELKLKPTSTTLESKSWRSSDSKCLSVPSFTVTSCPTVMQVPASAGKSTKPVISPTHSHSHNRLAKNFVQEFHDSVLQTTRQKEMTRQMANESHDESSTSKRRRLTESSTSKEFVARPKTLGFTPKVPTAKSKGLSPGFSPNFQGLSPTVVKYSPTMSGYSPTIPVPVFSPTRSGYSPSKSGYSPTVSGYSPTMSGYSPSVPGFSPTVPRYSPAAGYSQHVGTEDWPGIDGVMETYHKHHKGEKLEKQILLERNKMLRNDNAEMTKTAERLSQHVEELMRNKHQLEELRCHNQERVDMLKSSIKKLK